MLALNRLGVFLALSAISLFGVAQADTVKGEEVAVLTDAPEVPP